jgi:hypothetical protein
MEHQPAFAATVEELMRLFPGLTPLQANLVAISAVRNVAESTLLPPRRACTPIPGATFSAPR